MISGELGGRKLVTPQGLSTRPTTDKVRQAVFNSLGSMGVLDGATVADLYAGCGALGQTFRCDRFLVAVAIAAGVAT